ncbi:PAS/PAC sensor hybrid histidine kinase [Nostoc sp. NIES-3756]|uniref:hybrid sensor histidine kinase/response regulator n=1 Tax=Nostoc sp. NIES-3756 TaxID=1751286 RepID=UPI000721F0F5|nr:PAS domain S-box protein [Nostoc sp. NIES-3756]BAT51226.1 PAS/PAC sensor hybrid histidine kinase [Nostoc sp. NIES-3756]
MSRLRANWDSLRYDLIAILLPVLGAFFTAVLAPFLKYPLYAFFYAAVALSAWYGGIRPGILTTILSAILLNYVSFTPIYSFKLTDVGEIVRIAAFFMISLLIGSLNANLQYSQQKLEKNLQALGESEEKYRVLTENIPQLVWFADTNGSLEYLNQGWYDYTGLTPVESLGWKWQQVIHPEDLPIVLAQWNSALDCDNTLEIESRLRGRDGSYRWHITRAVPVINADGITRRWFGSATDIHEHKQIQQALYQQEQEHSRLLLELETQQQQLAAVVQQMPGGLIIAEAPSGKLLLANTQVEEIWRYPFVHADEIEEYQAYQGFHADGSPYKPHEWPMARSITVGEVVVNEEINFLRGDGTRGVMLVNSAPIRDQKGQITAGVVTFHDITERKQAQEALRESEERFRQMAERIEDVFWVSTTVNKNYQVLYVSPAYESIWGCSCESLYNNPRSWMEAIHPEDQQQVIEDYLARSPDANLDLEFRVVRPDGSIRWIRDRIFPILDEDGNSYRLVGVAEDITERKQTELALQESQALFTRFMHHMPGCAFIKDEQGKYVFVNPTGARLVGLEQSQIIGKTDFDLVSPNVAQQLHENDQSILNLNQTVQLQEIVPFENEEHYWMTFKFPFTDVAGRRMLAGMSFDITERKHLEDALKASEKRFRCLVDAKIIGVIVANSEYIIEANDTFLEMLGYTQEDLAAGNLQWRELTPPEYLYLDEQGLVELQTTGKCTPFEKEFIRKDGSRVPILIGGSVLEESPPCWLCFVLDISERKQAETALRQSEERFRLAARAVAGIVYDWDVKTGAVFRSQGLYRLIGVRPEDAAQTQEWWSERIHPDDIADIPEVWDAMLTGNSDRYDFEYRVRHEDGHWVYLWDRGYVIRNENGELVRVVGSSADISDRKLAEIERVELLQREQAARAKAEEANRIKDEFLAVLSHELRSPLNPILGWTKLLLTRQLDQTTVKNALETIERNAKLQTKLIDDLLDVSRILRGKLTLNIVSVNLVSTITEALETVRLAAEAKSLQIQTIFEDLGMVRGDGARLQQVVWNLLSNAVKFTPAGGEIEIRLEKVDSQAQIQVRDTGIGIEPEFIAHIFEYFRQADSSTTRNFGGLGLGLAIVRHLVELHGGTIRADSQGKGQGATFTVQLPLIDNQGAKLQEDVEGNFVDSFLGGVRVLTVDDEADTRDYLACALEQAGAEVIVATSAEEVLRIIIQSQVDILLADIGMPNMDGYTLMRQIRQLPKEQGGDIVAIALTAYTRDSDQQQAMAAGFQRHLSKPIDPFELAQAIVSLLGNR